MEVVLVRSVDELAELVWAAKAGDRVAFTRLIERDAPRAYTAALAVLRSSEDAQDATQDATLRAWQHLSELRDPSSWPLWFRRIAIRSALDHAARSRHELELPRRNDAASHEPDFGPAADERLTILAALARLSADDRAILGLRFGADLEIADLAAILGIRLGTAKARLHRALRRLEMKLTKDGDDDDKR